MVRFLLLMAALLGLASATPAQIYAVHFKEEKFTKGYKKQLFEWKGEKVVLGEYRAGGERAADGSLTWKENARLEFFVADQSDPSRLPYVLDGGGVKKAVKKQVVAISVERIDYLEVFVRDESFYTLSMEYERRMAAIEKSKRARKEASKGSSEWFAHHSRLLHQLETLQVWLRQTGYVVAANKLSRDLLRERKAGDSATHERLETALASVKPGVVPDELVEAARRVCGKHLTFSLMESQHIRLFYHDGIPEAQARRLLELGEQAIETFRKEMVDPYRGEDFLDLIPDRQFIEFFFGADNKTYHEKLLEEFYGQGWGSGEQRRQSLEASGSARRLKDRDLKYWRIHEQQDQEGVIVHGLGHALSRRHYRITGDGQDWLEEAAGYHLSFEVLNRNNVTCSAFKPPEQGHTVAKGPGGSKKKEEDPQSQVRLRGLRDVMAGVAFHAGTPMDRLIPKNLYDFGDEDTSKSWAFYHFVVKELGKSGQVWLRGIHPIIFEHDFLVKLRLLTEATFTDLQGDAMTLLEQRWKDYIEREFNL